MATTSIKLYYVWVLGMFFFHSVFSWLRFVRFRTQAELRSLSRSLSLLLYLSLYGGGLFICPSANRNKGLWFYELLFLCKFWLSQRRRRKKNGQWAAMCKQSLHIWWWKNVYRVEFRLSRAVRHLSVSMAISHAVRASNKSLNCFFFSSPFSDCM